MLTHNIKYTVNLHTCLLLTIFDDIFRNRLNLTWFFNFHIVLFGQVRIICQIFLEGCKSRLEMEHSRIIEKARCELCLTLKEARRTEQTQIRCCRMRLLIRVCTVCIQKFLSKMKYKKMQKYTRHHSNWKWTHPINKTG